MNQPIGSTCDDTPIVPATTPLFTVGWYKGEMDFGIREDIADLSIEHMKDLREMIIVAIGTMENMWRRRRDTKQVGNNKLSQAQQPPTTPKQ